jgi:hydroxymethylglutaryl-CoA reductase (NADPH)
MLIPQLLLRKLYTYHSLRNTPEGVTMELKNRLMDVVLARVVGLKIGADTFGAKDLEMEMGDGVWRPAADVTPETPAPFPLGKIAHLRATGKQVPDGILAIEIAMEVKDMGKIKFTVEDHAVHEHKELAQGVPYSKVDNLSDAIIKERQQFLEAFAGIKLKHITHFSFDPKVVAGNIENFTGVAQVPLGFAGPLQVNGEHAQGKFIIPLATAEGTLVASYNRGMKVINLSGGVTCTVQEDHMQRAPVFIFADARKARDFRDWVRAHMDDLRREAEATTRSGKLMDIEIYLASKFAYLRFNFTTGDAAGQNMVGRATYAACSWILDNNPSIVRFYLESNLATDKKASHVNVMNTRGKRVTAELVIKKDVLREIMRVEPESLHYHFGVASIGSILSGANNNGAHSPNGITAMFIATGQDVANVSEGSSAIFYADMTPEGDLYCSITIPSLIVATHGGGVGLPTQRECLEILGCFGKDKVKKFAEIVAGVVMAGEISLASAISSLEWVSSHEQYGRNR